MDVIPRAWVFIDPCGGVSQSPSVEAVDEDDSLTSASADAGECIRGWGSLYDVPTSSALLSCAALTLRPRRLKARSISLKSAQVRAFSPSIFEK